MSKLPCLADSVLDPTQEVHNPDVRCPVRDTAQLNTCCFRLVYCVTLVDIGLCIHCVPENTKFVAVSPSNLNGFSKLLLADSSLNVQLRHY